VFLDPQGRRGEMQAGLLPAPFHMAGAFAKFAPLTLIDKLSIAWAMLNILQTKGGPGRRSVWRHLHARMAAPSSSNQGGHRAFLRVVLVSALDEELTRPTLAMASMFFGKRSFPIAPDTAWCPRRPARRTLRRLQVASSKKAEK